MCCGRSRSCRRQGDRRLAARGADFDDDDGAQGKVSEISVGEDAVSGILCQPEAEPVCCGAVERLSRSNPGSIFAFANQISLGASLNQDVKRKFRLTSWTRTMESSRADTVPAKRKFRAARIEGKLIPRLRGLKV